MNQNEKIYVAGHTGLIGSAVVRRLQSKGYNNLLLADHADLELIDSEAVDRFFNEHSPKYVVLAAGKVGGIYENQTYPADFISTNLAIHLNLIKASHASGVRKLIMFASSCMYPRKCSQPMSETALMSGRPESTSLSYAISKLASMQMCLAYNQQYSEQRFIPIIPNSAYGPNDNFDPNTGHVLSSLIHRFHEARQNGARSLTLWGSGKPRREFIHADDIAEACIALLAGNTSVLKLPVNVGTGKDISILKLAETIARVIGYTGAIKWDTSKMDGAMSKLLDSSRIRAFGWQPTVEFKTGIEETYQWFIENEQGTETN